jgi:hypothetical protein
MIKHVLRKFGLFFVLSLLLPTTSMAISVFSNNDLVILWGEVKDGDERQLQEALTPAVKYLVFRGLTGGSYDSMKRLARVVKDASVTTVIHGPCTFTCSRVFLAGKERLFSGEGRPENHYFLPTGAFFADGSASSQDYAYLNSNADIPGSLIREYAQMQKRSLLIFPTNAKFSQNATAYGCDGKSYFSAANCTPLKEVNAMSMKIITSETVYRSANLKEAVDMPSPAKTDYAKITDAPNLETIHNNCRTTVYQDYLKQEKPKAFVISRGSCYMSHGSFFKPNQYAMDNCKKVAGADNCRFYAVDDDIVFTPFK